jgi:hypothetical protein
VKASLFPNSAALVLIALALGSLLMGQPYSRARADAPPPDLDATLYDLLITNARVVYGSGNPWYRAELADTVSAGVVFNVQGFILFTYDFTARPSELNPDGDYLECIRRAAFNLAVVRILLIRHCRCISSSQISCNTKLAFSQALRSTPYRGAL